jgi:hypothetical protein
VSWVGTWANGLYACRLLAIDPCSWLKISGFGLFGYRQVVPELPRIISGFIRWYPKFPNKIQVPNIMGLGIGLWVFLPRPSGDGGPGSWACGRKAPPCRPPWPS